MIGITPPKSQEEKYSRGKAMSYREEKIEKENQQ